MILNSAGWRRTLFTLLVSCLAFVAMPDDADAAHVGPKLAALLEAIDSSDEVRIIVKMRDSTARRAAQGQRRRDQKGVHQRRGGHRHLKKAFGREEIRRNRILRRHRIATRRARARRSTGSASQLGAVPKSLWLINGVAVAASKSSILSLARDPDVSEIVLDEMIVLAETTHTTGAVLEWNLSAVGAETAWDLGHRGAGIVIATMDTGADIQHPDLASSWRGGANSWIDFSDPLQTTPRDPSGHGTQVMGLLVGGQLFGSAIGMAPEATWIAAKIFDDMNQASISDIHLAFQWLLDPDGDASTDDAPHVVNASWGLVGSRGICNPEFAQDIEALRSADIAVVFAAGNEGPGLGTDVSPANNGSGLSVGSVNMNLDVSLGSSRGPSACTGGIFPTLSAPGIAVWTTDLSFGGWPFFAQVSGTSFAAPHVSGALALLRGAFPAAPVAELEAALVETAADLGTPGPDNEHGQGFVDVAAAMQWMADGPACESGSGGLDTDLDGTDDSCDNCVLIANPAQRDTDSDGYGNRCDADFDNDGTVTMQDVARFIESFGTTDPHADFDGDGFVNFFDVFVLIDRYLAPPGPSGLIP